MTPRPMTNPDDVERARLALHGCETEAQMAHWARSYGEALCLGMRAIDHDLTDGSHTLVSDRDFA